MSVAKKDQVFPASWKPISDAELAIVVAAALRRDFGNANSAIKRIGKGTNINLRAIKNWYEARNTPSSGHLLLLARVSPSILKFVLEQIGGLPQTETSARPKEEIISIRAVNQDKIYSTGNCTINITISPRIAQKLNQRQLWFLSQLQQNEKVKADDIAALWGTSIGSAKSDISEMTRMGLIRFYGAKKTGLYKLVMDSITVAIPGLIYRGRVTDQKPHP